MKIFDEYVKAVQEQISVFDIMPLPAGEGLWPVDGKTPFIMERDMAIELGGYPKESINLILASSAPEIRLSEGVYLIGSESVLKEGQSHISFGKIVFLETEEMEDDKVFSFMQLAKLTDIRLKFQDVMLRTSTEQFFINLRVSKKAMSNGFSLGKMGNAVYQAFSDLSCVTGVRVILLAGESLLYRRLLPEAEKVHQITTAMNTILDGIDMDCSGCSLNRICAEVEGLRRLHQKKQKEKAWEES